MPIRLIIFDMDGVIFHGDNFWIDLHKKYGTLEKGLEYTRKYLKSDYHRLIDLVVNNLWKGKPAQLYFELIKSRSYEPGVVETIKMVGKTILKAIITSGPSDLARRAERDLDLNFVFANELLIKNDLISGEFIYNVDGNNKKP